MNDDLSLADLLGQAPGAPDPGFRYDVIARVSERARRRVALRRAVNTVAAFTAIGLVFPLAQAAGLTLDSLTPLVTAGGAVGVAYVLALVTIQGPRAVLARSRALSRL